MNICMVLAGQDFPPDIRVEKEAVALLSGGHEVTVVCDSRKRPPGEDNWEDVRIIRLPMSTPHYKMQALITLISFAHPFWARNLDKVLAREDFDVLHVHDLPMAGPALALGRKHKLPVVMDLHENWPAALRYYRPWRSRLSPLNWDAYELRCAREADQVLVVVDEARDRLVERGLPGDKITVIENTPNVARFTSFELDRDLIDSYKDKFVLSYIGGFGGTHRGLETVVRGMPRILKKVENAHLLLVGQGKIKPRLEAMIAERGIGDAVTFLDWQPFEKVPSFVKLSDVCLVPHHSNPHTEATSPHKLFQYMLMERPVLVSSCKPLARVVENTGAGLIFKAGDADDFAEKVIQLDDIDLKESLGAAGLKAVTEHYNWDSTGKILLKVYEQLASP
ncbi:MAG: glycosyltransferase family 4 protein [Acidobacteriota bacterium]|nr:glycosyltransferase family 4 protein [Acidobacteriota bacterium]